MENCRDIKPFVLLKRYCVTDLVCHYCYHSVKVMENNNYNHDSMTSDHVVPRSRGGVNTRENRVIACFSCNATKHNGDAVEFAEAVKKYGRPGDSWGKRGAIPKWRKISGYDAVY